jgi:Ca2+-binding EF-hand superfamily protein
VFVHSDTLEKAQKEIKRFRYFCSLIAEKDLDQFVEEKSSTLSKRVKMNDQEENRALGVLMAVKEKMSKRFISLREAFSKIDVDNSGYVDKQEFLLACQFWGLTLEDEDLQLMLSLQSDDEAALRKGVDYKAFMNMLTVGTDQNSSEEPHTLSDESAAVTKQLRDSLMDECQTIQRAFEKIDTDNSGYIDAGEMAKVFEMFDVNCTRECLNDLFETYDTDQDNRFCYDEFAKVFEDMTSTVDVADDEISDRFQ